MKIKIGDKIIDSENDSFMIMLETHEKKIIANLGEDNRLLFRPEGISVSGMHTFYKWDDEFKESYCKTPAAHDKELYCSGCWKIKSCHDSWMDCMGNASDTPKFKEESNE